MEPVPVVAVAAITYGPHDFIVMSAPLHVDVATALPAIASVIAGSIASLVLVWAGVGTLFEIFPGIQSVLHVARAAYLIRPGSCLIRRANGPVDGADDRALPGSTWGVAGSHLLNPRNWVPVLTAVSAVGGTPVSMASLAVTFDAVMGPCLRIWFDAGQLISRRQVHRHSTRILNTVMSVLLTGSETMLLS